MASILAAPPLPLPPHGRYLVGKRAPVVQLLVGSLTREPDWMPRRLGGERIIPRLAVKVDRWSEPAAQRFEWRVVAGATVLAIDVRERDARVEVDGWDEWLWLLADVRLHARELLLFTPTLAFNDPPKAFAPERELEIYAWLSRDRTGRWPPWWPHGDTLLEAAA